MCLRNRGRRQRAAQVPTNGARTTFPEGNARTTFPEGNARSTILPTEANVGAVQAVDPEHVERRLAAILSADAVGYTRLMARGDTVRAAAP